jgi:hypothetical protein
VIKISEMEERKGFVQKKGGPTGKSVKRNQLLGVKCSMAERNAIEARAKSVLQTVSEYLRKMGLTGKIDMRIKALPKEVLLLTATLNHLAANLNQIAKKRNGLDELNALERAELQYLSGEFKQLVKDIKNYLQ